MKYVSIVGDSVSTFQGYNPSGYAVFYDKDKQILNELNNMYDTWWSKVIKRLDACLCVNNSFSGSKVSGDSFPSANSLERLSKLSYYGNNPNYILIYIGFNDFGNGVKISGKKSIFHVNMNPLFFEDAYSLMLMRVKKLYPKADIMCGTLLRTYIKDNHNWRFPEMYANVPFYQYNDSIRKVVNKYKCTLIDMDSLGVRYETLDGSHPTASGHKAIADAWIECLHL